MKRRDFLAGLSALAIATPAMGQMIVNRPRAMHALKPGLGLASAVDLNRYLFWATRAKQPSGSAVLVAQAATNYVMTKLAFGSPQYATNSLRLHFSGFACTEGSAPQETVLPGNATIIDEVWVSVNGAAAVQAKFAGANGVTIASGANGAWTDDIAVSVPPEAMVMIYTIYHTAAGENQIPSYRIEKHRGEAVYGATDAATLRALIGTSTASTASLDTNYGSANNQPAFYGPDMMVAKGWDGRPVVLAVNDSIGERQDETAPSADARGNKGWMRRWLDTNGAYGRTPHFLMGVPGASSSRELSTNALKRWAVLDECIAFNGGKWPFTCVIDQMGINDYTATYSTMLAAWKGLVDRIKARYAGVKVIAIGTTPRTSASTDNYLTTGANQTYSANGGVYPTGNYYLLDADKAIPANSSADAFIDLIGPAYTATAGKWPAASFQTTLAAQAGTDGTTPYNSITLTAEPMDGELLRWGTNGAVVGVVASHSGSPGAWVCVLDRLTNTTVVAAGGLVYAPATSDGTHPRPRETIRMAAAVPQSEKSKLI